MEVRLFSNPSRPGVGCKPRRESLRPLLPQHARHCPVLEAGSALGYLVYPSLADNESFHIEFQGEGRYQFTYALNVSGSWHTVFGVTLILPIGSMGTPPGAIALRGATNFQTPRGWDTVYTPVFNQIERPIAPMLVVRVETDWYAHDTEFRYVLQPGEGIPGAYNMPIGQVFFVPAKRSRCATVPTALSKKCPNSAAPRLCYRPEPIVQPLPQPYGTVTNGKTSTSWINPSRMPNVSIVTRFWIMPGVAFSGSPRRVPS